MELAEMGDRRLAVLETLRRAFEAVQPELQSRKRRGLAVLALAEVYGVGRDFGLTSDPTKAMKAAVVGRPFRIRFGGRTDFQYVADTADAFIRAATSDLEGAHVFNLHGETTHIADIVAEIERAWPRARGAITHDDAPLAFPSEFDDAAVRAALGTLPATPLADGVRATVERFAELQREGRLETSDLDQ